MPGCQLPPNLTPERLATCNQLQGIPAWQTKAEHHAVVALAGLLAQSAEHGDRADADAVLST